VASWATSPTQRAWHDQPVSFDTADRLAGAVAEQARVAPFPAEVTYGAG
jgi:hypothetical protein